MITKIIIGMLVIGLLLLMIGMIVMSNIIAIIGICLLLTIIPAFMFVSVFEGTDSDL